MRAFTLIELLAAIAACSLLSVVILAAQPEDRRKSLEASDIKNIRSIGQSFILWAQSNGDMYPLPGKIDKGDFTIAGGGAAKNTTANIFSLLLFAKHLTPQMLVSPLETNPNIAVCDTYEFTNPKAAAIPDKALWDPAFSVDFTKKGGLSYSHMQPSDKRLPRWSNTFMTNEISAGTRGPEIEGIDRPDAGAIAPRFANPPIAPPAGSPEGTPGKGTRACTFYGEGQTYNGQFVYNDGSVRSLNPTFTHGQSVAAITPKSDFPLYLVDGHAQPDLPFFDERDDASETNHFLGIFTEAGVSKKHFKGIWD